MKRGDNKDVVMYVITTYVITTYNICLTTRDIVITRTPSQGRCNNKDAVTRTS